MRKALFAVLVALVGLSCSSDKGRGSGALRLATTTSVKDSGLLDVLLPEFERKTGKRMEVSAVGSGQALARLQSGEADVAVTHAPAQERALAEAGKVGRVTPFMRNDFVFAGPADAAAVVAGAADAREVMRRIAASGRKFISRGDQSGTHQKERELWKGAGLAADAEFIVVAKAGMGATLKKAAAEKAFTLTDRATFLAGRAEHGLAIVFQGDDELANVYSVVEPKAGSEAARAFADFLRSAEGRAVIGGIGVAKFGEPLFTPLE